MEVVRRTLLWGWKNFNAGRGGDGVSSVPAGSPPGSVTYCRDDDEKHSQCGTRPGGGARSYRAGDVTAAARLRGHAYHFV